VSVGEHDNILKTDVIEQGKILFENQPALCSQKGVLFAGSLEGDSGGFRLK
jgi:hypothetical protein